MALASTLKNVSSKLIKKFGDTVIIKKIQKGTYNPDTGKTEDIIIPYATKGIAEDYVSEYTAAGDLKITLVFSHGISLSDLVTYQGRDRAILSVRKISIQDSIIIYEVVVSGDAVQKVE